VWPWESKRYRRIVVRFDDRGVVTSADFVELACSSSWVAISSAYGKSPPCIDVASDAAPDLSLVTDPRVLEGERLAAAPNVPEGERLAAVFVQVGWLSGQSEAGKLPTPATGTLTLTDRSLVFVNRHATADRPVKIVRIPYVDIVQVAVASRTGKVLTIELPTHEIHIFEAKRAGTFTEIGPFNVDPGVAGGAPNASVVDFIAARAGKR
jgi:hypothetical protein